MVCLLGGLLIWWAATLQIRVHSFIKNVSFWVQLYFHFNLIISLRICNSLYYCCCSGWTFCGSCTWYHVGCMVLFRSVFFLHMEILIIQSTRLLLLFFGNKKGVFKNPCCCPCYLCACCGGLGMVFFLFLFFFLTRLTVPFPLFDFLIIACLECLACGLCCEGVSEI